MSDAAKPTYDPAGSELLSDAAKELSSDALDAYAVRAELLLGIADTDYTGKDKDRLVTAVALQVNRLVRLDQRGGGEIASESKGDQSIRYVEPKGGVSPLDLEAKAIVDGVVAGGVLAPRTSTSTPNRFVW